MRRLELDFLRTRPAAPWVGWLLLAAGTALALDVGRGYVQAQAAVARHEALLAQAAPAARAPRARGASREDLAAARETIERLATPWGGLFAALEGTPTEGVALLSVAPDPQGASVQIDGEAKDYAAVLAYLEALRRTPPLARAYLTRHEAGRARSRYPVAFTIRAPWRQQP
jgi:Tfp pilus assembly protein PilN